MIATLIPTPSEILERHTPLLKRLIEALHSGTLHAQEYAAWKDEAIDGVLASAHVRKGARRLLTKKGDEVENEEEVDTDNPEFETELLANLGLAINADGVQIRILKSGFGNSLPVPGQSPSRQRFYAQQQPLLFSDLNESNADSLEEKKPTVNLVLHWSTNRAYELERVYLACPKAGHTTKASVEAYWDELIWRRKSIVLANAVPTVSAQVEAEGIDLDIYLDVPKEESSDQ
jgi:hypothetical protein